MAEINACTKRIFVLSSSLLAYSLIFSALNPALAEVGVNSRVKTRTVIAQKSDASFYPPISQQEYTKGEEKGYAWTAHERGRLCGAGKKSLDEKDYQKALDYFDQALALGLEDRAAVGRADCLGHLNRLPEAILILKGVTRSSSDNATWAMLVDDLIKMNQFDNAYAACDAWRNYYLKGGNSFLLRSKIALAQGNRERAINCLLDGYLHCRRYETELADIIDALYELGVTPPDKVPYVSSGNEAVFASIDFIAKIKQSPNEREFATLFHKVFDAVGYPNGQSSVHNWSYVDGKAPIEQIDLTVGANSPIRMQVNQDLCSIHFEDIKSRYKYVLVPEDQFRIREVGLGRGNHQVELRCDDGYVVCEFSNRNGGMLEAIHRLFARQPEENNLQSASALKDHIKRVETFLSQKNYRKGSSELISHWTDEYPDAHTITSRHKMLLKKRDLLTAAYVDKPDIQAYLKAACLDFVSQDIDKMKMLGGDLPTIAEFNNHKWKQHAMVSAPNVIESQYDVWVETYPTIYVPQSAELFRTLYHEFGKLETCGPGPIYVPMNPVDRLLLDDASLAADLYFAANK